MLIVVGDGSSPYRQWPDVTPDIIQYSFDGLQRMDDRGSLATQGRGEICWYVIQGEWNWVLSHGSTTGYLLWHMEFCCTLNEDIFIFQEKIGDKNIFPKRLQIW